MIHKSQTKEIHQSANGPMGQHRPITVSQKPAQNVPQWSIYTELN